MTTAFDSVAARRRSPFHPAADPDVLFETTTLSATLDRLTSALAGDTRLAVLTGPAGTGKTAVLRRVASMLERGGLSTSIESLPLGLDELRDRLLAVPHGGRVMVGLDEAQALSRDVLLALDPILAVRSDLRILLVGEPELDQKLDALKLAGVAIREAVRCRLAPLPPGDVGAYVDCRWRAARGGRHPFAPDAIERVAALADGLPQLINLACDLSLHLAEVRGLDRVTADVVDEATADLPQASRPRTRAAVSTHAAPSSHWLRAATVAAVLVPPLAVTAWLFLRAPSNPPARSAERPAVAAPAPLRPADRVPVAAVPREPAPSAPPAVATPAPAPSAPALPPAASVPVADDSDNAARTKIAEPPPTVPSTSALPPLPPRQFSSPPRVASIGSTPAAPAKREPGKDEALLRRAEYGDLGGVRTLLSEGASPEARDATGFTPLMFAVIHGHPAVVDALIAGGGRVNVQNRAGLTPVMLAAINNHATVLRSLLDHGGDANARTRAGWTALTYAAWRGHADVVKLLLARGADPNVIDREGWTILQYATWRAAEPIQSDDLTEATAGAPKPTGPGPGHAEVVALLRQAGVKR